MTKIYSVAGQLPGDTPFIHHRPFRAKHHTIGFANQLKAGLAEAIQYRPRRQS